MVRHECSEGRSGSDACDATQGRAEQQDRGAALAQERADRFALMTLEEEEAEDVMQHSGERLVQAIKALQRLEEEDRKGAMSAEEEAWQALEEQEQVLAIAGRPQGLEMSGWARRTVLPLLIVCGQLPSVVDGDW